MKTRLRMIGRHPLTFVALVVLILLVAAIVVPRIPLGGTASALPVAYVNADYPTYETSAKALDAAEAVVAVEYVDSWFDTLYPDVDTSIKDPARNPQAGIDQDDIDLTAMGVPVVVSQVVVTEVFSGKVEVGQTLEVQQLGGPDNGVMVVEVGAPLLGDIVKERRVDQLVLLLDRWPEGHYTALNPDQGVLVLRGDEAVSSATGASGTVTRISLEELRQLSRP
ncbi:hypothetical protein LGT39_06040 [Demequina sp. TTPB684]|uniref:hypothetical protein n=1 Tax=unclassified Demequina TaxID=2620311 RepID=UPI001CF56F35|nr:MULTISPECIES: hypothetical protein [unclassified Demequina]MCB2412408.1 hypothetical protein [Demequina sp. TTPB684]UPU89508.1 hypothetical protein LGT36_006155 [Demequina sp. TMPB413]